MPAGTKRRPPVLGALIVVAILASAGQAGFWWAIAAGFGYGARTSVNDVPRATTQRNWRLFGIVVFPITPRQGFSVSLGSGGNAGAGTDFDVISIGYRYAWGGG